MSRTVLFFFLTATILATESRWIEMDISNCTDAEISDIISQGVDVTYLDKEMGRMHILVSDQNLLELQRKGFFGEPLIDDMEEFTRSLRQSDYFSKFHSYDAMVADMQELVSLYPDHAALYDIGDSYLKENGRGGHDIWALKISDDVMNDDQSEAEILYMANLHAREIITPEILLYFMRYLLENYNKDGYVTHLVDNRQIWCIPTTNPDGHELVFQGDIVNRNFYSQTDPLWWRKNLRDNNENGELDMPDDGVDLNRNFGFQWGYDDDGSSPDPAGFTYRGPSPFSEPESQVIRDFVQQRRFLICLSYHSYGNLWLYPWGFDRIPLPENDAAVFQALADSCVYYNGYNPQSGNELYPANGDTDDWFYGAEGIWAFTPEVGSRSRDLFYPDTTRIEPLILENLGPNLYMAYAAGEEPIVQHQSQIEYLGAQRILTITATISPPIVLTDSVALDSSSVTCFFYMEQEEPVSATLAFNDSLQVFETRPALENRYGMLYYYVQAADATGRIGRSPRSAPFAVDSIYVIPPVKVQQHGQEHQKNIVAQCYPNPFNAVVRIVFSNTRATNVVIDIFNGNGRSIRRLVDGFMEPGEHRMIWDGTDDRGRGCSSGVYYCSIQNQSQRRIFKLVYLK